MSNRFDDFVWNVKFGPQMWHSSSINEWWVWEKPPATAEAIQPAGGLLPTNCIRGLHGHLARDLMPQSSLVLACSLSATWWYFIGAALYFTQDCDKRLERRISARGVYKTSSIQCFSLLFYQFGSPVFKANFCRVWFLAISCSKIRKARKLCSKFKSPLVTGDSVRLLSNAL